jgi:ABC-2 type transport system ATP-binding protein
VAFVAANVLTAHNLTRRFGDRVAVEDVSFDLAAGEIFALLGPNGSGKTTTLRMLAGLIAPSSGSISVQGETLTQESAPRLRRHIGFLTEAPGLWDRLTVRQNLTVFARLHGLAQPHRAVDEALELFEMGSRAGDRAAHLSKGLKQRVALARALLHDPRIVLLDEPTAGLDPGSAHEVRELIRRLRDRQRVVLLSTHNLDEAQRVANHVAILRTRLIAVDTPAALKARLFEPRVRVVLTEPSQRFAAAIQAAGAEDIRCDGVEMSVLVNGRMDTPALVRHLVQAGAGIESVVRVEPSLEDVYLKLVHERRGSS